MLFPWRPASRKPWALTNAWPIFRMLEARLLGFLSAILFCGAGHCCGILEIKDGYFWDPALREYFVPRGFAYQTFNPPVGADQSLEQLAYDLTAFKKLHANSARV